MSEEAVNHPKHYNSHPSGIEVIEIIRHEEFNLGNTIKYILRSPHKKARIEDLKKAAWYLNDEIKRLENEELRNLTAKDINTNIKQEKLRKPSSVNSSSRKRGSLKARSRKN